MGEGTQDAAEVAVNLALVRDRIAASAKAAGRDPALVTLVAVSKSQKLERIEAALEAGQRVFGENYVQEAAGRWPELRQRYAGIELHMIGALQSNKAAEAVAPVRRHPDGRPAAAGAGAGQGDGAAGPTAAAPDPGQHRRGAAEGGRGAGRADRPSSPPAGASSACPSRA